MSDAVFPVPAEWAKNAKIDNATYLERYQRSVEDPDGFWREESQRIDWIAPFQMIKDTSFNKDDFHIRWFEGGKLNISANCLDRHLAERGDDVAILPSPSPVHAGGSVNVSGDDWQRSDRHNKVFTVDVNTDLEAAAVFIYIAKHIP